MTTALKNAIERKEYIVVTGWKPPWMFGRWDLKFLKQDEDKVKWEKGNIHIMGREDLENDDPVLAQFLKNMFFTDKQLASLMLAIREAGDDADTGEVCAEWMEDHEELIKSWIPEDAD
jgi:glycine betaine/proline transport system substrate-binding protein